MHHIDTELSSIYNLDLSNGKRTISIRDCLHFNRTGKVNVIADSETTRFRDWIKWIDCHCVDRKQWNIVIIERPNCNSICIFVSNRAANFNFCVILAAHTLDCGEEVITSNAIACRRFDGKGVENPIIAIVTLG